jgi:hypothetical protein
LTFSDALIIVGANVTASVGSSTTPMRGSRRSTSASACSRSLVSIPSASMKAIGSGERSSGARRRANDSSSGAIFTSALSPTRGIDACPARPLVVTVKRKTPFSPVPTV